LLGITSKSQQVVDQLEMPEVLGQIPWGGQDIKSQRVVDQLRITSIQILNLSQRYFILQ
jgi:hypothetical protein